MEKRRIDSSKFNLFLANVIIDFDISMHKICRNEKNIFLYLVFFLRVQHSFTSYNKTNFRNCINNNKYFYCLEEFHLLHRTIRFEKYSNILHFQFTLPWIWIRRKRSLKSPIINYKILITINIRIIQKNFIFFV